MSPGWRQLRLAQRDRIAAHEHGPFKNPGNKTQNIGSKLDHGELIFPIHFKIFR